MDWGPLALPGLILWSVILLLPWRPWSTRESLDCEPGQPSQDITLSRITALIPARNEEDVLPDTLDGLIRQDKRLAIILVDDQSTDATAEIARRKSAENLQIVNGRPMPEGWTGKLWALQQGKQRVNTDLVLLLDADIRLEPGILAALEKKLLEDDLAMISLMANLRMKGVWEKLAMPAFIFFFKLLYPFHLANSKSKYIAAAAGGCILIRREMLDRIGAFNSLRDSLIDDCALARKVKEQDGRTWLGLTHSVISLRRYDNPGIIWDMVARTAFTQLHYSWSLLLLCTALMAVAFIIPLLGLLTVTGWALVFPVLTLSIMMICYLPVIRYYAIHPAWALALPITGILFMCMTWTSAYRHLVKSGAHWKGRYYSVSAQKKCN